MWTGDITKLRLLFFWRLAAPQAFPAIPSFYFR